MSLLGCGSSEWSRHCIHGNCVLSLFSPSPCLASCYPLSNSALLCSGLFLFSLPLSGLLLFFLKMITPHALFILFGMSSSSPCSCTWGVQCVYEVLWPCILWHKSVAMYSKHGGMKGQLQWAGHCFCWSYTVCIICVQTYMYIINVYMCMRRIVVYTCIYYMCISVICLIQYKLCPCI